MKNILFSLLTLALLIVAISCKSEAKNEAETMSTKDISVETQKQNTSTEVNKSVMVKIMTTTELKSLASALVGTGLAQSLMDVNEEYTVFAPSAEGFESISKELQEKFKNIKNKEEYSTVLKNHLYAGTMSSADLLQAIKPTGSYAIRMVGGAELTATLDGENIVITDSSGQKAIIGKSDIQGSNGTVHMIDRMLTTDLK